MPVFSETVENQAEDIWGEEAASSKIQYTAMVEFNSYISTLKDQDTEDAVKKNELKGQMTLKYGSDNMFFYTASYMAFCFPLFNDNTPDFYKYSEDAHISRNLRFSSNDFEIAANEFYLNFMTDNARFRIGNQVFNWGTTNLISPTTYFNPGDFREMMFNMIQEDPMTGIPSLTWMGTPAISVMVFPLDCTLELVVTPIYTPMLLPLNEGFWKVKMDSRLYSVYFDETEDPEVSFENTGVGMRLAGSLLDADVSLSAYHGPDKDAVLVPSSIELPANESIMIHVRPGYYTVNKIGVDMSYTYEDLGIQFEAVYSPDKTSLPEISMESVTENGLPIKTMTSQYVQCAAGVNYLLPIYKILKNHQGLSVVFAEYSYQRYFDDASGGSVFPNLLAFGYMDSFLDNRLSAAIMAVVDQESGSYILRPQIGYKIRNNLKIQVVYTNITGKSLEDNDNLIESAFYYFRDNDVVMGKIAYTF